LRVLSILDFYNKMINLFKIVLFMDYYIYHNL